MRSFKLSMMITFIELYTFLPVWLTLIKFHGSSSIGKMKLRIEFPEVLIQSNLNEVYPEPGGGFAYIYATIFLRIHVHE